MRKGRMLNPVRPGLFGGAWAWRGGGGGGGKCLRPITLKLFMVLKGNLVG